MSITQNNPDIDFTDSNFEEKKELIPKLSKKQKELADFLLETYPNNIDLKIHLMFIKMICPSTFDEYFPGFIPNEVLSEDEFPLLFASKLDDYLCQLAQNVNKTLQNLEN